MWILPVGSMRMKQPSGSSSAPWAPELPRRSRATRSVISALCMSTTDARALELDRERRADRHATYGDDERDVSVRRDVAGLAAVAEGVDVQPQAVGMVDGVVDDAGRVRATCGGHARQDAERTASDRSGDLCGVPLVGRSDGVGGRVGECLHASTMIRCGWRVHAITSTNLARSSRSLDDRASGGETGRRDRQTHRSGDR